MRFSERDPKGFLCWPGGSGPSPLERAGKSCYPPCGCMLEVSEPAPPSGGESEMSTTRGEGVFSSHFSPKAIVSLLCARVCAREGARIAALCVHACCALCARGSEVGALEFLSPFLGCMRRMARKKVPLEKLRLRVSQPIRPGPRRRRDHNREKSWGWSAGFGPRAVQAGAR